jgi:rhodanese-related sulfurtransferase
MARKMSYDGKYKLSRHQFNTAKWYALGFNEWLDEYNRLKDSVSAISYENGDMPHAVNKTSNPTEELAERRAELRAKMDKIVACCNVAGGDLSEYLLKAVTNENVTYHTLKALMDIPCSANTFYDRRRKFYWLLAKEL